MSPANWGPPVWTLFHTLAAKLNESHAQHHTIKQGLFSSIKQICRFLPCPDCSSDATIFLNRVKPADIRTKQQLIDMLYVFHNYVNRKKNKAMFVHDNLNTYKTRNIVTVLNEFAAAYNTRGNMKLMADSLQRQRILVEFKKWIITNSSGFADEPTQVADKENITLVILDSADQLAIFKD
jgi:hypothetical protein